jgi:DNA repair protein RadD
VVDEAHHTNANTWSVVLRYFSAARVLGVTATPIRSDGRGLGEHYEALVEGPGPAWLTENGFLAAAKVYAPPVGFDAKAVHRRMGDYDMKEAEVQLQARRIMGDVISHYRSHLDQRTAIAFCCSIAHAEAIAAAFNEGGIAAASIDGTMDTATRRELLERLGAGELKVLTSCALIVQGVDVPSVGGCILLRPTQSEALHLQMIGRCLRPQDGKVAVVLDHVGNVQRLGHHLEQRQWTLNGRRTRQGCREAMDVKMCPSCFAVTVKTAMACSECGHRFEVKPSVLRVVEGELQEVSPHMARRRRARQQGQAQSLEELVALGVQRGMKNPRGWAWHVLASRQAKGQWSKVR